MILVAPILILVDKLNLPTYETEHPFEVRAAWDTGLKAIKQCVKLSLNFGFFLDTRSFFVNDDSSQDVYLEIDFYKKYNDYIDLGTNTARDIELSYHVDNPVTDLLECCFY